MPTTETVTVEMARVGALSKISRRGWPTDKIRPGESVPDYCRRLDVYENLRNGAVHQ